MLRKRKYKFILFLIFLSFSFSMFASEGHTFGIEEDPFYPSLKNSQDIDFQKIAKEAKTPAPVQGIEEATTYKSFYFDPTYTVPEDIQDHNANYLARKGQTIDPIKRVNSLQDLIFFDGTNKDHVIWAKKHPKAKWILVKGSPIEIEEKTEHPTYFDQMGGICRQLGIKKIPCRISIQDNRILIEEIPIRVER